MIGERLADLRKDRGMTQKDLANQLHMTTATISAYEREINEPNDDVKKRIALLFDISLDYLVGLIDSPLPISHKDTIVLPQGLTSEAIPSIEEFIELMRIKYSRRK